MNAKLKLNQPSHSSSHSVPLIARNPGQVQKELVIKIIAVYVGDEVFKNPQELKGSFSIMDLYPTDPILDKGS